MNGYQLTNLAMKSTQLRRTFVGVFARDSFAELGCLVPGAYVINSSDRGSTGHHWTCVFVPECIADVTVFFDSLGAPPENYSISIPNPNPLLAAPTVLYNPQRFQAEGSGTCGLFCLYILHWLSIGVDFQQLLKNFCYKTPLMNEKIILDFERDLENGMMMNH